MYWLFSDWIHARLYTGECRACMDLTWLSHFRLTERSESMGSKPKEREMLPNTRFGLNSLSAPISRHIESSRRHMPQAPARVRDCQRQICARSWLDWGVMRYGFCDLDISGTCRVGGRRSVAETRASSSDPTCSCGEDGDERTCGARTWRVGVVE